MARKSKPRRKTQSARDAAPTSAKLVAAAAKEFNQRGFDGTDTNRIARRAGFAPQTFYRWFRDKTEIFLAAYHVWEEGELAMMAKAFARKVATAGSVGMAIDHYRATKVFRRSLRSLSLENGMVRKARTESRRRQIEQIKFWVAPAKPTSIQVATILLQMERLAEAVAEGEFADLGLEDGAAHEALAELQMRLRR